MFRRTAANDRRLHIVVLAAILAVAATTASAPADARDLDPPERGSSFHLRLDPGGGAVGAAFHDGPFAIWGAAAVDLRSLGMALHAGAQYPLVDGPKYSLDAWSEVGPEFLFRGVFAVAADASVGLRNVFGRRPVRWSAGVLFDTAISFVPELGARYRPSLSAGLGVDGATARLLPDGVWLRGTLGYDFRPARLGAVHADIWLAARWRLGSTSPTES